MLAKASQYSSGGVMSEKLIDRILFMIAKDNMPLCTTEREGFRELMKFTSPHFKMPSRTTITSRLEDKYVLLRNSVICQLSEVNSLSLTMDIWTEQFNTVSYLGVTSHYMVNYEMKSMILGVFELDERHIIDYLINSIKNILEDWEIPLDKVDAVTTDGAANIVGAVKKLFGDSKHICCFAHILNLIVAKSLEDDKNVKLKQAIDQVKKIVTWFHHSVVGADVLKKVTSLKLIQSVSTRWNSVYTMIKGFIELADKVTGVLINIPQSPEMISADQLQLLREVASALSIFNEVTVRIQSEETVTISNIIPYTRYIIIHLNAQSQEVNSTTAAKLFIAKLKEAANIKLGALEQVNIACCATILDPRFKRAHFENPLRASKAVAAIRKLIPSDDSFELNSNTNSGSTATTQCDTELDGFLKFTQEITKNNLINTPINIDDLSDYLNEPNLNAKLDPLSYWKGKRYTYPALYDIASRYLYIPATSTPSERVFSLCGVIMTARRNKLSSDHLNRLLFLHSISFQHWTGVGKSNSAGGKK